MDRKCFSILLLLILSLRHAEGQHFTEDKFDRYTTADGMSHNTVSAIAQDSAGYIWIATSYGLNRFNGSRFVQVHSNSDSLSLPAEDLTGMAWLDKYRLAVFSNGLYMLDTRTNTAHNLFIPYHDLNTSSSTI